jgi:RNA polymerase sigma-70 factor, ECF subfamily
MVELANEVVARARAGDADAYREILTAFERPIFQTVFRLVGGRFPNEIEDIAQEIFLKVFRALDRFEPERGVKFSTWVYTFVKNHCFDVLKKRRVATVALEDRRKQAGDSAADPPGPSLQPSEYLIGDELANIVAAAVAELSDDQRLAFVLREYEGLDYREIATISNCSEGTVKSRLHRAKEALRYALRTYAR